MVSKKLLTLVMVRDPLSGAILLGMKKRGFGEGKWNGFGGKVEAGETIPQAAARELTEECCLKALSLTSVAVLNFEFLDDPVVLEVHVFSTQCYVGEMAETEEMRPKWFKIDDIPFNKMWPDDAIWIPWYLKGQCFKGYFLYKGFDTIIRHEINILNSISVTTYFDK